MDYFFLKMKGILMNKSLKIHIDNRKKKIQQKSAWGNTFSPFSKENNENKKDAP